MALYGYSLQVYADSADTPTWRSASRSCSVIGCLKTSQPHTKPTAAAILAALAHEPLGMSQGLPLHPHGRNRRPPPSLDQCQFPVDVRFAAQAGLPVLGGLLAAGLGAGLAMARIPAFRSWVTTNINLWMTMLLGGLWHGASWTLSSGRAQRPRHQRVQALAPNQPMEAKDRWKRAGHPRLTSSPPDLVPHGLHTTWATFGTEHDIAGEWSTALDVLHTLGKGTPWNVIADALHHYGHVFGVTAMGCVIHLLPSAGRSVTARPSSRRPSIYKWGGLWPC